MPLKLSTALTFNVLGDHDLDAPSFHSVQRLKKFAFGDCSRTWEIGVEIKKMNRLDVGHGESKMFNRFQLSHIYGHE